MDNLQAIQRLRQIAEAFEVAYRTGESTDMPEGVRVLTLSDTVAKSITTDLRAAADQWSHSLDEQTIGARFLDLLRLLAERLGQPVEGRVKTNEQHVHIFAPKLDRHVLISFEAITMTMLPIEALADQIARQFTRPISNEHERIA